MWMLVDRTAMSGHIYAVAGGKGGVGKTTSAINLGAALRAAGHDTIVVDADLAMANLGAMVDVRSGPTLHDVLASEAALHEALVWLPEDGSPTRSPPDEGPHLVAVPGSRSLDAFADADPDELGGVLRSLADAADFVLCDTGAGLSHENAVPLGVADGVVVVTTPDPVAVADASKTIDFTARAGGTIVGAVVTHAGEETDISALADELGIEILAVVPETDAAGDEPLVEIASESYAADAYERLAATLADRGDPGTGAFADSDLVGRSTESETNDATVVERLSGVFDRSEND
ncbi:cell division ATPase MinD/septum site-determining protein MinD [Halococcus thailandensis JCM 13552]|uniref:Cell division ATPase MinD/septum site-determining protein MinD n=2 Tax=Halococcus thailandensis TaxID=335952 RepID=M0N5J5_9EURY|nr:cell division ATPase MinD/septum site-determining protein MinD [Halococcus thailandensis JCM 13552]